jgi:hypothetical protein
VLFYAAVAQDMFLLFFIRDVLLIPKHDEGVHLYATALFLLVSCQAGAS